MTILLNIALLIIATGVFLLVIHLISTLKLLKDALISVKDLVEDARREIKPTVSEIRISLQESKDLIADIDKKLQKTNDLFELVEDISKNLKMPVSIATAAAETGVITLASLFSGVKEGVKTFLKKEEK